MPSRLPTSTAYWNLRAEQVMDQVFHAAEPSLKAVEIQVEPAPDPANNPVAAPLPTTRLSIQPWQQLTLVGVTLGALLCSAWLARNWQLSEQALYRERNLVERFFNIIKHFRAIATRYEKTARNYLAGIHLVCAIAWLK